MSSLKAVAKLLDEIEELVGQREQRVIYHRDDQPTPIHDENDFVIVTQALDPVVPQISELHRGDQRTISPVAQEFAPPQPQPAPQPEPVQVPVQPMFASPPGPGKPDTLQQLAASAGLFAEQDGLGATGLFLLMQGRTVLFCGSEQRARQWLADRAARPRHRQVPLGQHS